MLKIMNHAYLYY